MKTQTENQIDDQNGNKSKPLLSSRLFKFRAWDTDNNEFVNCDDHQIRQMQNDYGGLGNRFIYSQFTGLIDKNKKEIFEGDILEKHFEKYEVLFNNCEWVFTKINDYYKEQFYRLCFFDNLKFEVIGNIFEKSELI